mmetsp:Transcript_21768/g.53739  ORF Transcript_21768/g.53739 Transcript_21768/m.53739 type:complete len:221 (-) Transcript_21768:1069-1731(-)
MHNHIIVNRCLGALLPFRTLAPALAHSSNLLSLALLPISLLRPLRRRRRFLFLLRLSLLHIARDLKPDVRLAFPRAPRFFGLVRNGDRHRDGLREVADLEGGAVARPECREGAGEVGGVGFELVCVEAVAGLEDDVLVAGGGGYVDGGLDEVELGAEDGVDELLEGEVLGVDGESQLCFVADVAAWVGCVERFRADDCLAALGTAGVTRNVSRAALLSDR